MPDTPVTWLQEFTASTTGGTSDAHVIQLSNGNILVAWTSSDDSGAGSPAGLDILGQIFDPLGVPRGSEFLLNLGYYVDDESDFDIAATSGGDFVVVYEDDPGADTDVAIRADEWSSTPDGTTTMDRTLTVSNPADAGDIVRNPSVNGFDDGSYMVSYGYFDASTGASDLRAATVNSGGTLGAEFVAITGSSTATSDVASASLTNGNTVMVYDFGDPSDNAIAFSIREPDGTSPVGGVFVSNTSVNGDDDFDSTVAALTGGGFVIAWANTDTSDTDVEFQIYDANGAVVGGLGTVSIGSATNLNNEPVIAPLADGGFIIFWDNDESGNIGVNGQRYTATGSLVGAEFQVSTDDATGLDAVLLGDGRVAIAFSGNTGAELEIIDPRDTANDTGAYSPDPWVIGTPGDDVFTAAADSDTVHGWNGNDDITENGREKFYFGGTGDDTLRVTSSISGDRHDGGKGIDLIDWRGAAVTGATFNLETRQATAGGNSEVMANFEQLTGTENADTIYGRTGADTLRGAGGNDMMYSDGGGDYLLGQAGDDTMVSSGGTVTMAGGAGTDTLDLTSQTLAYTLDMTTGVTALPGESYLGFEVALMGSGDDSVTGTNGGDNIVGNDGNDVLTGGAGKDTLDGGDQNDVLDGGDGDDVINGGQGADSMIGGNGNDLMAGGNKGDTIDGGAGNDTIGAGSGDDEVSGGGGNDLIRGGDQDDSILGGIGSDTMLGGTGIDYMFGGGGDDILRGRGGFDILIGGDGDDLLEGGAQADQFVFADGWGDDVIVDFNATNDAEDIDLSAVTAITNFTDLVTNHMTQVGADVFIDDLAGNTIRLVGVNLSDLHNADFDF